MSHECDTRSKVSVGTENPERSIKNISAIILNYRTPGLCIELLKTLPRPKNYNLQICVIDNYSNDDSLSSIQAGVQSCNLHEDTAWIQADRNGGFSFGNNLGVAASDADAYLLLNSDTIVHSGAIEKLIDALEMEPSVGIVGPRLEWPDSQPQKSCFNDFRPSTEFFSAAATGRLEKLFGHQQTARELSAMAGTTEWISFACVLVRRQVFENAGMMDEGYFLYFEDADFCRAAREAGFSIMHCPDARVVHLRGGSGPVKEASAQRKRRPRYWYASRARYYAKWYGWHGLLAANLFWTAGRTVSIARELLWLKKPHVCAYEWRDIWTNFLNPMKGPKP